MVTRLGCVERQRQLLSRLRVFILRGFNSLLAASKREAGVSGLDVNVSINGFSDHLCGLFLLGDVCEMLNGKDYHAENMVTPIIEVYIDCATRFQNDPKMTGVHRT